MSWFKPEVHVHVHIHGSDSGNIAKKIRKLKKIMGQNFDELKALADAQNAKLVVLQTAVTGLTGDIANLTAQVGNMVDGATKEQVDELKATLTGSNATLDTTAAQLKALDEQTPPAAEIQE